MAADQIQQDCKDCKGTGLFQSLAASEGSAVVCPGCKGEGWRWLKYTAFRGRKPLSGVQSVRPFGRHAGHDNVMTYAQFEAAHPSRMTGAASAP